MKYNVLKMHLNNIPWDECYDTKKLEVKEINSFRNVDDKYADDISYGGYIEDDELAFWHAVDVFNRLCGLKNCGITEDTGLQVETLQEKLLEDFQNYLYACEFLEVVDEDKMLTLLKMAGSVCDPYIFVNFVKKHWNERKKVQRNFERDERDNYVLDFPEIYLLLGDSVLYEKHDLELAIEFYQLALLEWNNIAEKEEAVDKKGLQRKILYYKRVRDTKYTRIQFDSNIIGIQEYYKCYSDFFKIYSTSLNNTEELVLAAEEFAELFHVIKKSTFFDRSEELSEYRIKNKEDFRLCYMMALQIYNHAFLWSTFLLINDSEISKEEYKEDVIRGIEFIQLDFLQPVKEYWLHGIKSRKDDQYEIILMFLQITAYVELIQNMLREKNPQQDVAYYTSLNTFRYMLPEKTIEKGHEKQGNLSIMHVAYMNDPNEGKTLWNYCGGKKLAYMMNGQRRSAEYPFVFLKCFTPLIDDLPMWEMYGDRAEGCCIVFDKAFLRSSRLHVPLYKVCYLRKKNSSYEFFLEDNEGLEDGKTFHRYLMCMKEIYKPYQKKQYLRTCFRKITEPIIFLFKDANYQHERELRIMYRYARISKDFQHTKEDYPKLYISPELFLRMKEIILGSKLKDIPVKVPYLQEELEKLCQHIGYKAPVISISEIEYQ